MQELSALVMDVRDNVVIAAYHEHAYCPPHKDQWARKHIHGLDPDLLKQHGFKCDDELFEDFHKWLTAFPKIQAYFANNPTKEKQALKLEIQDIGLPVWSERRKQRYHRIPNALKEDGDYLFMEHDVCCHPDFHSKFQYTPVTKPYSENQIAKASETYHCSLSDVTELFLFYRDHYPVNQCFACSYLGMSSFHH